GAITQAMARECKARGVSIMTNADVARVIVQPHRGRPRATGIALADGRVIEAHAVAANVGPRVLFERMVDASVLDDDFRERIRGMRTGSGSFRLNLALSELPDFTCAPGTHAQAHHGAGILFAPSLRYMERAYFDARSREHTPGWSREPIVELNIGSTLDDTLAPPGKHVASVFCQHFDPALREDWDRHKPQAVEAIFDVIARYAPNFRQSVLAVQALSPMDLERMFGLIDGDIFHGALQLNQLWAARPVLGHGDYRMPIDGLYLCGSGAHPGGGVTGVPGMNAAREITKDARRSRLKVWRAPRRRG
ncbi:MAG TPA: NAD(P)/FAD-dependent oxidoreductase, partial [Burkholderiaceae bacterium]|nr:NAD(P)/FAD-dependent oxidoreductase [Burkholderiaceae bacterium]